MTPARTAPPRRWHRGGIALAVRILSAGPVRDRYRQELLAELYGMSARAQTVHTLGVLSRIWALRAAVAASPRLPTPEVVMPRKPLTCRLNLRHVWRTSATEDGTRYRQCARCGKDYYGGNRPPAGWAAGL